MVQRKELKTQREEWKKQGEMKDKGKNEIYCENKKRKKRETTWNERQGSKWRE
jgi:hypothetical protein